MISEHYLSLKKVNQLLPPGNKMVAKIERALYSTDGDDPIAIGFSKRQKDGFWYCMTAGYFARKGVKVFCLVAGNEGIFLIPKKTMGDYCKQANWRERNKGRSYFIRIKQREGKFFMFDWGGFNIDITDLFIPLVH